MSDKNKLIKSVVLGTLSGMLLTVILLCVFSLVMLTSGLLPSDIISIACIAIIGLGCLFAGFVAVKINRTAGLIVGLITGLTIFVTITAISLIKSSESVSLLTLIKFAVCIILGGLGGIIGLREKSSI